jgi:dinuclear metal center YbgI/SA1388 family protein
MTTISHILSYLHQVAPFNYQESYDNSGLLVGDASREVTGVIVALDCTEAVIDEAIAAGANVVLTHHPIVFKGLKRLTGANYVERTVIKAIQHDIALIAIHTNLDNVYFGVNHIIASKLNLTNKRILAPKAATLFKLSVFVPHDSEVAVRTAMAEAGAGQIGDYDNCSFTAEGTGRFRPNENADPFIGTAGQLEAVSESRIEVVVNQHALKAVEQAMKKAHPYEEVAYDVVAMLNTNQYIGSGMVGDLAEPVKTMDFLQTVKETFQCGVVRHTNTVAKTVQRVAVCGGSGGFLLPDAIGAKADVFITADYKYHEFFDADGKIVIADIGHFESEQYTSEWLVLLLMKKFTNFAVRLANVNTNPINYL